MLEPARRYQLDGAHRRARRPLPASAVDPTVPAASPSSELDRQLLAIPAATYVPALTGRQPNRAGKIRCPFHDDAQPQPPALRPRLVLLRACRTGGSIYDFGALLYGLDTRGREFLQLRQRLAEDLHLAPAVEPQRGCRRSLPASASRSATLSQRTRSPASRSTACQPPRRRLSTTAQSRGRTVWRSSSTAVPPSCSTRRTTTEKLVIRAK